MEGIEIVVTPKIIERVILGIIIIALVVLLIIKWNGSSCTDITTNKTVVKVASNTSVSAPVIKTNITNQTNSTNNLCANGIKDQDESDIDCGGTCSGCPENKFCNDNDDCVSGLYCYQHIKCMKPSCDDAVKNQDETNIDCGGTCGGYWWTSDSKCHTTQEPSGKLAITLSASVGKSELSGNAILNSVTMNLDNGLANTVFLKANIFALTASGKPAFPDQEGNNIAVETVDLEGIASGTKLTKTVDLENNTRKTLVGIKSTDAYQLMVEFRDQSNDLVDKKTWTNSG